MEQLRFPTTDGSVHLSECMNNAPGSFSEQWLQACNILPRTIHETITAASDKERNDESENSSESRRRAQRFEGICFQGGGAKCITYPEAVLECVRTGHLFIHGISDELTIDKEEANGSNDSSTTLVNEDLGPRIFSGASAGALFALLFYVEMPIDEIRKLFLEDDLLGKIAIPDLWTPLRFARSYGACTTWALEQAVKGILEISIPRLVKKYEYGGGEFDTAKTCRYATFADLERIFEKAKKSPGPRHLLISAANMNRRLKVYLTGDATPNLELFRAIAMSMAYPGVFVPVMWQGDAYMDGGLMDNFPMAETSRTIFMLKKESKTEPVKSVGASRILGFQIVERPPDPDAPEATLPGARQEIGSFHAFLESLSDVMMQARDHEDWKYVPLENQTVIYIETQRGITALASGMTLAERYGLAALGKDAVARFVGR